MFEAFRDGVFLLIGVLLIVILADIQAILSRAEHINQRVNANVMEQLSKPLSVTINQEKPLGVAIDNDELNVKVQK